MTTENRFSLDRRRLLGLVAAAGAAGTVAALGQSSWALAGTQSVPLEFVVISNGAMGSRAHLYPDVSALLAHGMSPAAGLEFFDSQGSTLVPVFDQKGQLTGVRDSGDGADPEAVIGRLQGVVQDLERVVREDPARIAALKLSPEEALARLPRLDGVDIGTAFERCRDVFGHAPTGGAGIEHSTDPWHNFWVHGIF